MRRFLIRAGNQGRFIPQINRATVQPLAACQPVRYGKHLEVRWHRIAQDHVHIDRSTVEKLAVDCLDVRELQRAGIFRDNWVTLPMVSFRWPAITQMRVARYLIQLELQNQVVPQQIRVSWTRCHYGGARPWLHCPCGRRVAKLLKGLGGYYCRQCFDSPRYASQTKSTQGRLHFEACKLRLRLGGVASLTEPFPERPRGMHRKTYARLRRRAEELEAGLSSRLRSKPADYASLVYYLP